MHNPSIPKFRQYTKTLTAFLLSLLIATQPVQVSAAHLVANAAGLLHGVVGCASAEAAGGNCASGFITAFGTEIASGYMGKGFEPDPNASAAEQEQARQAYVSIAE